MIINSGRHNLQLLFSIGLLLVAKLRMDMCSDVLFLNQKARIQRELMNQITNNALIWQPELMIFHHWQDAKVGTQSVTQCDKRYGQ